MTFDANCACLETKFTAYSTPHSQQYVFSNDQSLILTSDQIFLLASNRMTSLGSSLLFLPIELICRIFEWGYWYDNNRSSYGTIIAGISRYIKNIAHSMPILWSTLHYVGYGGVEDDQVSLFRTFLERSGNALLTVHIELARPESLSHSGINVTPSSAIQALSQHICQCQVLTISSNESCDWELLGCAQAPALTHLTIPCLQIAHLHAWTLCGKRFAQNLQSLAVDGLKIRHLPEFPSSLINFTGLDIKMIQSCLTTFAHGMKNLPNLEHLTLSTDGLEPTLHEKQFDFPCLTSLTICGNNTKVLSLLSLISAMSLTHLITTARLLPSNPSTYNL